MISILQVQLLYFLASICQLLDHRILSAMWFGIRVQTYHSFTKCKVIQYLGIPFGLFSSIIQRIQQGHNKLVHHGHCKLRQNCQPKKWQPNASLTKWRPTSWLYKRPRPSRRRRGPPFRSSWPSPPGDQTALSPLHHCCTVDVSNRRCWSVQQNTTWKKRSLQSKPPERVLRSNSGLGIWGVFKGIPMQCTIASYYLLPPKKKCIRSSISTWKVTKIQKLQKRTIDFQPFFFWVLVTWNKWPPVFQNAGLWSSILEVQGLIYHLK